MNARQRLVQWSVPPRRARRRSSQSTAGTPPPPRALQPRRGSLLRLADESLLRPSAGQWSVCSSETFEADPREKLREPFPESPPRSPFQLLPFVLPRNVWLSFRLRPSSSSTTTCFNN